MGETYVFKRKRRKILESKLKLIDYHEKIHTDIIKSLSSINNSLRNKRFDEAAGRIVKIYALSDLLEKQIKMHMTQEILDIYETNAKLSYSLQEVERKRNEVFGWLSEVTHMTKQLQYKLRARKKDPEEIYHDFDGLLEKICYDARLTDFLNTLRFLVLEFERYRDYESTDRLTSIFNELKLHPIVKKSSKKLFRDGHYASAIFETYKALNNYVKKRSKQETLDGKSLMTKAFGFKYDPGTDQIQRRPLLQLNELRNQSDRNEQEGFMHLFMGSMLGIRNPKAHDLIEQKDPFRTLEYLSFASLLAKRLDEAKLKC